MASGPPALGFDDDRLRRNLRDLVRFLESQHLTTLNDEHAARVLTAIGELVFDCLNVTGVETELSDLIAKMPGELAALSQRKLREEEVLGLSVLQFWDLALGALSPPERGLRGTVADQIRRALETQQHSSNALVRESARSGMARLGGTFPR